MEYYSFEFERFSSNAFEEYLFGSYNFFRMKSTKRKYKSERYAQCSYQANNNP